MAVQKFMGQLSHRPRWWARWWCRKRPTALPSPVFTILNKASEEQAGREHVLGTEEHQRKQPASARHHGGHSEHAKGNHEAATFWQEVNEIAPAFLIPDGACVADEFVSITQQLGALSFGTATKKVADVKKERSQFYARDELPGAFEGAHRS